MQLSAVLHSVELVTISLVVPFHSECESCYRSLLQLTHQHDSVTLTNCRVYVTNLLTSMLLFGCSFDAIGLENAGMSRSASRGSSTTGVGDPAACLLLLPSVPGRRGSFLYRSSDSDSELSPMSLSRKHSAATSDSSASVTHHLRGV